MGSLSFFELQSYAQWLQAELENAQLQDAWTNGQVIVLQFYKFRDFYVAIETSIQSPQVVLLEERPPVEKRQKPVVLFLHSHAKNLRWQNCFVEPAKGRVLEIELKGAERQCHLEIRLIPKAFNLLVTAGGKSISWDKLKSLPLSQNPRASETSEPLDSAQEWGERGRQWLIEKFKKPSAEKKSGSGDPRIKAIEKKKKALSAIESQLQQDASSKWKFLGESLKLSGEVPSEFAELYDTNKSRSWNLERAFQQAKHLVKKKAGTMERLEKLQQEIEELEEDLASRPFSPPPQAPASKANQLLEKAKSKGRKLQFENGIEALMGKSAADNLALLRKAQAWDLWLHLKDYPGSHAIIVRPRNKAVSTEILQKVSEWLIRESLGNQKIQWGLKYDVVVVECRHVRPIKGDQLGRVTYHHPQVFSFASKPS